MSLVAPDVLLAQPLMAIIISFQPGLFNDIRPFRFLAMPETFQRLSALTDITLLDRFRRVQHHVHAVLAPWLAAYSVSRLVSLVAALPRMRLLVMLHALCNRDLDLVRSLDQLFSVRSFCGNLLDIAATMNDLPTLEFLHAQGHPGCTPAAMDAAAKHGNLPMVIFLHRRCQVGCTTLALVDAIVQGHVAVVQYLRECHLANFDLWPWGFSFVDRAASAGHLDMSIYLKDVENIEYTMEARLAAARNGHFAVVQWLLQNSHAGVISCVNDDAIRQAASAGHMDIVKLIHETAGQHDHSWLNMVATVDAATKRGDKAIVLYLYLNGWPPCSSEGADAAAGNGLLDFLKWLYEYHQQWSKTKYSVSIAPCTYKAVERAARHNHIDVIRWLVQECQLPITQTALDGAATGGHLDLLQWLWSHKGYESAWPSYLVDRVAGNNHLKVVQWLLNDQGATCTTQAMDLAAANGHLEMVQWLHTHRTEGCTTQAMDRAAGNGHLDVLRWLHEHRREGCTSAAMEEAAKRDRVDVVRWLLANREEGCLVSSMKQAKRTGHAVVELVLANAHIRATCKLNSTPEGFSRPSETSYAVCPPAEVQFCVCVRE
ncbi:Aste57867_19976 [Aphanomyces stellatus]|uniref:Aste57867_19976 protein n=1 Tax=Aphanomyces stellatus TaxID=120398 RepID=A0A485LF36_9STRA|nr:hypothetical protein As57867_019910 [Aphanomyces stellatus]VFT96673.1 Aste57867_19976 [Aphanomyces stellatus]